MIQKAIDSLEVMKKDLVKEQETQERDMEIIEENVDQLVASINSINDTLYTLGEIDQSVKVIDRFAEEKKKKWMEKKPGD